MIAENQTNFGSEDRQKIHCPQMSNQLHSKVDHMETTNITM